MSDAVTPEDAAQSVSLLLRFLGEDPARDGLLKTPARVVKALQDLTVGYRMSPKEILGTTFAVDHDELVTLDHIEFTSMCEHHLMVFSGQVHVGYIPAGQGVVGISKLARLVDCFARRLQVQERMTNQIAQAIQEHLTPKGVAVVVEARHFCVCARGVGKQSSVMRTSAMLGAFHFKPEARAEFLALVKGG